MIVHRVSESGVGAREHDPGRVREAIHAVEGMFSQMEGQIPIEPRHYFVPGVYVREITLPAGSFNTGKLHAQDDILIIASGSVTFFTEHGEQTLIGPCVTTVKANTKPLVRANTDVVMVSAHANPDNTRDLDLIESRVVIPNELGCEAKEVLR